MDTHIENHPHAFLDENNNVINVSLFDNHDVDLLNQVKEHLSATDFKSCCEFGIACKPGNFYNNKFYPEQPYPSWIKNEFEGKWEAPTPYPADNKNYIWDEISLSWVEVLI